METKNLINQFFDINKLPPEEGILVFPISMSRISNSQNAKNCWEYMKIFSPDKIIKPIVGLNFIYGDYLYFNSDEKASILKNKYLSLILSHKNNFLKIIFILENQLQMIVLVLIFIYGFFSGTLLYGLKSLNSNGTKV